jgi:hypothetical protein
MLNVVMLNVVAPMYGTLVVNKKIPEIKFRYIFRDMNPHCATFLVMLCYSITKKVAVSVRMAMLGMN